jgi:hypothetical protein
MIFASCNVYSFRYAYGEILALCTVILRPLIYLIAKISINCERCNAHLGFIKCWEVLEWLHSWRSCSSVQLHS